MIRGRREKTKKVIKAWSCFIDGRVSLKNELLLNVPFVLNAVSVYRSVVRNQEDVTWDFWQRCWRQSTKIPQHRRHFNVAERSWPDAHMGAEEMQMHAWSGTEVTLVFRRSSRCINFPHNAACVSLRDTSSNALMCSVQVDEREGEQEKGR